MGRLAAGKEVVPISVNQSRLHMTEEGYLEKMRAIVVKYKLPPNLIELEITETIFADFDKGKTVVKVFENRGRDIAPAFVGFKDIYQNYDLCLHLHSKKSPHASNRLFGWGGYLYNNLLGSEKIVRGIFKIMENEKIGVVFPQYFTHIRLSRHWGENYLITKNLLSRLNIQVSNANLIEFPSGSMFWFKPAALAPLFESDINFSDFPEESGQIDGTFAH